MLFYLSDSLLEAEGKNEQEEIKDVVSNLSYFVFCSKHLLRGDYKVLEKFREDFKQKDDKSYRLLNSLIQDYATSTIPENITEYVVITYRDTQEKENDGKTIRHVSYNQLKTVENFHKTVLACEDLNDCEFYAYIAKWFIRSICKKNLHIEFDKEHGGGGNTYRVVNQKLLEGKFTLCITDTDKKYPKDSSMTEDFKHCQEIKGMRYKFLPINVHEIENLIPLNYIDIIGKRIEDKHLPKDANFIQGKKSFDYLKGKDELLRFFDYKKGIHKKDIEGNQDYKNYAQECYQLNKDYMNKGLAFNSFLASLSKDGIVYPGLSKRILTDILNLIKEEEGRLIVKLVPFQEEEWKRIGQTILNWCIARDNEAIN